MHSLLVLSYGLFFALLTRQFNSFVLRRLLYFVFFTWETVKCHMERLIVVTISKRKLVFALRVRWNALLLPKQHTTFWRKNFVVAWRQLCTELHPFVCLWQSGPLPITTSTLNFNSISNLFCGFIMYETRKDCLFGGAFSIIKRILYT